jgi:glycosyltransferase involved in cell wall biosynthesis
VTYKAAASGVAILVTKVIGVEDVPEDGVNGWSIERNSASIEARVNELAGDASMRMSMSQQACAASETFSRERMTKRYAELYPDLADQARA